MSNATALALVPGDGDTDDNNTNDNTETARKSDRQQVSLARGLRERIAAERTRIEGALPAHRRRSVESYTDLAIELGLRELAKVEPVVDPLAALGL
jgi:hypothetical protein